MTAGIIELDLHGLTTLEAQKKIQEQIVKAPASLYRLRLIHGYHSGTGIKQMIAEEYGYYGDDRVLRLEGGWNEGITDLILREF